MTSLSSYLVAVRTGDVFGAGTEANAFVMLHGESGSSQALPLVTPVNHADIPFAVGHTDVFAFPDLPSVGTLSAVTIWHDSSASAVGNAWFVDGVQVLDLTTQYVYHFECRAWLAQGKDDHLTERSLPVTRSQPTAALARPLFNIDTSHVAKAPPTKDESSSSSDETDVSPFPGSSTIFKLNSRQPFVIPEHETLVAGRKKKKKLAKRQAQMGAGGGVVMATPAYGGGYGGMVMRAPMQMGMQPGYGGGMMIRPRIQMGMPPGYGGGMMIRPGMQMGMQPGYGMMMRPAPVYRMKSWSWSWSL